MRKKDDFSLVSFVLVDELWHGHSRQWKEEFVAYFEQKATEGCRDIRIQVFGHVNSIRPLASEKALDANETERQLVERLATVTELDYFIGVEN